MHGKRHAALHCPTCQTRQLHTGAGRDGSRAAQVTPPGAKAGQLGTAASSSPRRTTSQNGNAEPSIISPTAPVKSPVGQARPAADVKGTEQLRPAPAAAGSPAHVSSSQPAAKSPSLLTSPQRARQAGPQTSARSAALVPVAVAAASVSQSPRSPAGSQQKPSFPSAPQPEQQAATPTLQMQRQGSEAGMLRSPFADSAMPDAPPSPPELPADEPAVKAAAQQRVPDPAAQEAAQAKSQLLAAIEASDASITRLQAAVRELQAAHSAAELQAEAAQAKLARLQVWTLARFRFQSWSTAKWHRKHIASSSLASPVCTRCRDSCPVCHACTRAAVLLMTACMCWAGGARGAAGHAHRV